MIYLKLFTWYSLLGFYYESSLFKIVNVNKHSGALKGPYTLVYGLGVLICTLINNYLNLIDNTNINYIISYFIFLVTCTLIEFIVGHLIKLIYKIDSWDYSYRKYHFGKYICLNYALIWGLISIFFVKILNPFFFKILDLIPNNITIIILIIIIFDIIISFFKENKK